MRLDVGKGEEAVTSAEAFASTNASASTNPVYPDEQRYGAASEAETTNGCLPSTSANKISGSVVHGRSAEELKWLEQEREEEVAKEALRAFKAKQVDISYLSSNAFSIRLLSCLLTDASSALS
jgi:hypothetical protein